VTERPHASSEAAEQARQEGLQAGRDCFDAALGYAARGWSILCLCPADHVGVGRRHQAICSNPGKVPLAEGGAWKTYQERAASPRTIEGWWRRHANANVGVCLGPASGLVGVDVDGEEGELELARVSAGDVPSTLEFTTGDGRRLLYGIPDGVVLRTTHMNHEKKRPLSFLARGSQSVVPPSRHVSGRRYAWVFGRAPGQIEVAPAPAWLLAALRPEGGNGRRRAEPLADGEVISEGCRNTTLTSMGGTMRRRGFSEAAIAAALLVVNEEQCDPPLPEGVVLGIARSLAKYEPGKLPIHRDGDHTTLRFSFEV
jgi:hypothetical protein